MFSPSVSEIESTFLSLATLIATNAPTAVHGTGAGQLAALEAVAAASRLLSRDATDLKGYLEANQRDHEQ